MISLHKMISFRITKTTVKFRYLLMEIYHEILGEKETLKL